MSNSELLPSKEEVMESITRQDAKMLGEEIAKALAEVAEKHGLQVEVRGGTYDSGSFKPRVEFKTQGSDEATYNLYREMYDLPAFGYAFSQGGRTFRVSGFAPRSHKRPVLAVEVATGKTYKFTVDGVNKYAVPVVNVVEDSDDEEPKTWSLIVNGEVVKTSKSKASLQSFRSKNKTGGEIV